MTMTLVSTVTVGAGGAASIEFTGIPGSAADLLVVVSARSTNTWIDLQCKFNDDSTSGNYSARYLYGSGTGAGTSTSSGFNGAWGLMSSSGATSSTFGNSLIYISNYSSSSQKSISIDGVNENNGSEAYSQLSAAKWAGTSAITKVSVYHPSAGSFVQYSTASLYTITKGSGGATVA